MSEQPPPTPPIDPVPTPSVTPSVTPASTPSVDYAATGIAATTLVPANPDEKNMGMLAHLLGIFSFFIGPLIIWLVKKEQSKYIDEQAKEALNFQITASIALLGCSILMIIPVVGCLMILIVLAAHVTRLVFSILGTIAASKGEMYRYPLTIRLVK